MPSNNGFRPASTAFLMASALGKLGNYAKRLPMQANHPSTAHMFIVNPLSGGSLMNLFSTHPPLEERIARLRGGRGPSAPDTPDTDENRGMREAESTWKRLSG